MLRHIAFSTVRGVLLAFATLLMVVIQLAEALDIALKQADRPTITRAVDVVIDGPKKQVYVGDELAFTMRGTPGARMVRTDGFQIRVFSLHTEDSAPSPLPGEIDNCFIYLTTVFPIPGAADFKIFVTRVGEGWLAITGERRIKNGHYLLVFERVGDPDRIFRLGKESVKPYFATGLRLTVLDDKKVSVQRVDDAHKDREEDRKQLEVDAKRDDAQILCFRFTPELVSTEPITLAEGVLEMCDPGKDAV